MKVLGSAEVPAVLIMCSLYIKFVKVREPCLSLYVMSFYMVNILGH
jgi:hypothetical protein